MIVNFAKAFQFDWNFHISTWSVGDALPAIFLILILVKVFV